MSAWSNAVLGYRRNTWKLWNEMAVVAVVVLVARRTRHRVVCMRKLHPIILTDSSHATWETHGWFLFTNSRSSRSSSSGIRARHRIKSLSLNSLKQLYDRSGILPPSSGTPFQTRPPEPAQFSPPHRKQRKPNKHNQHKNGMVSLGDGNDHYTMPLVMRRRVANQRPASAKPTRHSKYKKNKGNMLAEHLLLQQGGQRNLGKPNRQVRTMFYLISIFHALLFRMFLRICFVCVVM